MRKVYVVADNMFSPLGKNTADNIHAIKNGKSGIRQHSFDMSAEPFYASLFEQTGRISDESKTFLNKLFLRPQAMPFGKQILI